MTEIGGAKAEGAKVPQHEIRRSYLRAMAAGLDANPLTSRLSIEALLGVSTELSGIDYSKGRHEASPRDVEQIEAIGSWYLFGSPQADQLKFTVGARALSLLKEDPTSGYFTNLREWVNMWTDGRGGDRFDKALGK